MKGPACCCLLPGGAATCRVCVCCSSLVQCSRCGCGAANGCAARSGDASHVGGTGGGCSRQLNRCATAAPTGLHESCQPRCRCYSRAAHGPQKPLRLRAACMHACPRGVPPPSVSAAPARDCCCCWRLLAAQLRHRLLVLLRVNLAGEAAAVRRRQRQGPLSASCIRRGPTLTTPPSSSGPHTLSMGNTKMPNTMKPIMSPYGLLMNDHTSTGLRSCRAATCAARHVAPGGAVAARAARSAQAAHSASASATLESCGCCRATSTRQSCGQLLPTPLPTLLLLSPPAHLKVLRLHRRPDDERLDHHLAPQQTRTEQQQAAADRQSAAERRGCAQEQGRLCDVRNARAAR